MAEKTAPLMCQVQEWDAYLDTMPPGPSQLRVNGTAECPAAGHELRVVRAAPQGTNPKDLILRLVETAPKAGAQVVSNVTFTYAEAARVGQFDTVTLLPGGTKKVRVIS
jgi:hypothetical protein